jgi:dipeptidyl aminopeptidase/acylaminoacyl peptidase
MIPWLSDSKNGEGWPQISPDGKYIFFSRIIPGEEGFALWISEIENPSLTIITESGVRPRWSKSGSGVYYLWNNSIFLTPLKYEGNQIIRQESELFCTAPSVPEGFGWDISNDDSRALILIDKRYVKTDLEEEESSLTPTHLKIKTNWFTELNRLVPLKEN